MTNTELYNSPIRLPLPQKRVIYSLSTDFYPWTELIADLERRQQVGWSAILDVQQDERWARYIWINGADQGGFAPNGNEVAFLTIARGLPNAMVTLYEIDPAVAEVIWVCRKEVPKPASTAWPKLAVELGQSKFTGTLLGNETSFWKGGRMVGGAMPSDDKPCYLVMTPRNEIGIAMLQFWTGLMHDSQIAQPRFTEVWRQVAVELSLEYPLLDPFDDEVELVAGKLSVNSEIDWQILHPALRISYLMTARRLGVSLADLAGRWREHSLWEVSGLEEL